VFISVWDHTGGTYLALLAKRVRLHTELHACHNSDLLRESQEYGISPESMHQALGGQYTDDMYMAWLKRREIFEKKKREIAAASALGSNEGVIENA
jgi:hypothetical protein